ncbi:MAG TPA: 3-dehydroquinate synthase [Parachlamydiales bacterium]|nr:3-dehydroquinate synthase [Parachlamydiales bacterium]
MKNPILIKPNSLPNCTQVYVGKGVINDEKTLKQLTQDKNKLVIVADSAIKKLYADPLAQKLQAQIIVIPSGEKAKSGKITAYIISELMALGAGRDTLLIAIGGGVTSDVAGFAASIYLRGIPLVLIPTTLLSAVDASIGGKTAINLPQGKNLIGTIHHPNAIFIDIDTLATLPEKEIFNGLAEIIKMGLIYDISLLDLVQNDPKSPALILQAVQAKIAIIEEDPTEQGIRRMLNFGHTIGHALESISDYEISHGEAVALGCIAESYLSHRLGYLSQENFRQILAIYSRFSLSLPSCYNKEKILQAMASDKKRKQGEIRFVLLETLGKAAAFDGAYCRPVSREELASTLDWMEEEYLCKSLH